MEAGVGAEGTVLFPSYAVMREDGIRQLTPLQLAFIGDAVFELYMRTKTLLHGRRSADRLNREKTAYVNAAAQARMADRMEAYLTQEEQEIYRRGKNARQHTTAKHQSIRDYHKASGLETLCGYLYLKGEGDRLSELLAKGLEAETDVTAVRPDADLTARADADVTAGAETDGTVT